MMRALKTTTQLLFLRRSESIPTISGIDTLGSSVNLMRAAERKTALTGGEKCIRMVDTYIHM